MTWYTHVAKLYLSNILRGKLRAYCSGRQIYYIRIYVHTYIRMPGGGQLLGIKYTLNTFINKHWNKIHLFVSIKMKKPKTVQFLFFVLFFLMNTRNCSVPCAMLREKPLLTNYQTSNRLLSLLLTKTNKKNVKKWCSKRFSSIRFQITISK